LKVAFHYHIYLKADKRYYSVPYRYRGERVDVFFSEKTVEIYRKNERIAIHTRDALRGRYATLPEHMPPEHRYRDDWSVERFLSWGASIDPDVTAFITALFSSRQHPEQAYKSCLGIMRLGRDFGDRRLANACRMALHYELYSYKTLTNILKHNMDRTDMTAGLFDAPLPAHENIRGQHYYATEATHE
jgi:hypothetical protein